jgi:hypothetical protein
MTRRNALPMTVLGLALCALTGCIQPKDAITVSNATIDFGLNEYPFTIQVWNTNPDVPDVTVHVTSSDPWLVLSVDQVTCAPPDINGYLSKQSVDVSVNRALLTAGTYKGTITFSGSGVVSKTVAVQATQPQGGQSGALNIANAAFGYSDPYLVDFGFELLDAQGAAIVAEPAQFTVTAREGDKLVSDETEVLFSRGVARQLKVDLIFDFTAGMHTNPQIIPAMVDGALDTIVPALSPETLIGALEFHRDDRDPARVADFTLDRDRLTTGIDAIESDFVAGFWSGSRVWDAIVASAEGFGAVDEPREDRYIILFSDGDDTSSIHTRNDAVNAAIRRNIHVFAVGFGATVDQTSLNDLTQRTGGAYFSAAAIANAGQAFQKIVQQLGAQYHLRWASLTQHGVGFYPSFTIARNGASDTFAAGDKFVPTDWAADPVQGRLRLVPAYSQGVASAVLRAEYTPRFISDLRIFVGTDLPYTMTVADTADGGLLGGWLVVTTDAPELHGKWIHLSSPDATVPFAAFGPLVRFDFGEVTSADTPLFTDLYVDDTIYASGQTFVVEGFDGTPPG